jgi:hypothetical protein
VTSELKLFGELLHQVWSVHERPWNYTGEAGEIFQEIADTYPPFGRSEELEHFLPSAHRLVTDFAATRRFLYLAPCNGQPMFLPVLSLKCDFSLLEPKVHLLVGLFLRHDNEVKAIGLRLESPEGEGDGIHDYYHAQYISQFWPGLPLKGAPSWLPVKQPAMTLEADGPLGLLLSLLVSLYGLRDVSRLALGLPEGLRPYVEEFTPDHWLVQSIHGHFKYKTWKSHERFKAGVDARHTGCTISPIDSATYRAEDDRPRRVD